MAVQMASRSRPRLGAGVALQAHIGLRPSEMLGLPHNGDRKLPHSWWWDRYFAGAEGLVRFDIHKGVWLIGWFRRQDKAARFSNQSQSGQSSERPSSTSSIASRARPALIPGNGECSASACA